MKAVRIGQVQTAVDSIECTWKRKWVSWQHSPRGNTKLVVNKEDGILHPNRTLMVGNKKRYSLPRPAAKPKIMYGQDKVYTHFSLFIWWIILYKDMKLSVAFIDLRTDWSPTSQLQQMYTWSRRLQMTIPNVHCFCYDCLWIYNIITIII